MDFEDAIRRLSESAGDADSLALATVDLTISASRPEMTAVLEAASIPHWFDQPTLEALLDDSLPTGPDWFQDLIGFSIVEPFQAHKGWNVHETTRLALRDRMARSEPDRFRELGLALIPQLDLSQWDHQIERVYHLLTADPDLGAEELRTLLRRWSRKELVDQLQSLGRMLDELCERDLLVSRARGYALVGLCIIRRDRLDVASREELVSEAVRLMEESADRRGLVDAREELAYVYRDQGRHEAAGDMYAKALDLLDELEPPTSESRDTLLQKSDLLTGMGRSQLDRSEYAEALKYYERSESLVSEASDRDPADAELRYSVAVATSDLGDAFLPTARSDEAEGHFERSIEIIEALPTDEVGWNRVARDVARLRIRLGDVLMGKDASNRARDQYQLSYDSFQELSRLDPESFAHRGNLADVEMRFALLDSQDDLSSAQTRVEAAVATYSQLKELDPQSPYWSVCLAMVHQTEALIYRKATKPLEALQSMTASRELLSDLTELDPQNATWRYSLASLDQTTGDYIITIIDALYGGDDDSPDSFDETHINMVGRALAVLASSVSVHAELVNTDPGNLDWQLNLARAQVSSVRILNRAAELVLAGADLGDEMMSAEEMLAFALPLGLSSLETSASRLQTPRGNQNDANRIETIIAEMARSIRLFDSSPLGHFWLSTSRGLVSPLVGDREGFGSEEEILAPMIEVLDDLDSKVEEQGSGEQGQEEATEGSP